MCFTGTSERKCIKSLLLGSSYFLDTDGVSDDIRAISLALQHPDVEVLAFTTVHGCVSVDQATANVRRCQRANGLTVPIPVYKGAREPIIGEKPLCSESIFFGKDGIGDQPDAFPEVLEEDFGSASEEFAAIALIRLAKEYPTATLVCLGPLTNVAIALKIDPYLTFGRVVIMGGNYY
ncbi:Inosine-uridine preferring nucleoside hydrolase, partial [Ostertagia ostertagi]